MAALQQNSAETGDLNFLDSEEIDFGSESFSGQPVTEEQAKNDDQSSVEKTAEATQNVVYETDIDEVDEDVGGEMPPELYGTEEEEHVMNASERSEPAKKDSPGPRLVQFPLSKVKQIMKFDPDVNIITAEAIFLVTRAAELFVQTLAKEAHTHTAAGKKKTMAKRDVELTIESVDTLMFLEGMMNT